MGFRIFKRALHADSDKKLAQSIKNIFGFRPGNIYLYKLAFLHKSVSQEALNGVKVNNERLEFLGDAILDAITAGFLFKTFPTKGEGFLTEMRSKIVSRTQLNKLSQKMGLDTLVQLDPSGTYRSFRGDALEAFIGAMFLDKGYRFTQFILVERIIKRYFDMDELVNLELSFKSKMVEWAQKEKKQLVFQVVDEIGAGYQKQYIVEVMLDEAPVARGRDYSIKGAEQLAAEKAWLSLSPEKES